MVSIEFIVMGLMMDAARRDRHTEMECESNAPRTPNGFPVSDLCDDSGLRDVFAVPIDTNPITSATHLRGVACRYRDVITQEQKGKKRVTEMNSPLQAILQSSIDVFAAVDLRWVPQSPDDTIRNPGWSEEMWGTLTAFPRPFCSCIYRAMGTTVLDACFG